MSTKTRSVNISLVAAGAAVLAIGVQYIENRLIGIVLRKAAVALIALGSHGYLVKPSPLLGAKFTVINPHDQNRPITDKLVWTSLIYGCASLYSISVGQYAMAALQLITCMGSSLYHLQKEAMYFNLDNIFASSLLFTTFFAMYSAYSVADPLALCLMAAGFPVAAFLIIYCGMPASVVACGGGCQRRQCTGEQYDLWHTIWHIVSGLGTAYISHFYSVHWPDLQCGHGHVIWWPELPLVPTAALFLAFLMNIMGNVAGVMPVL